MPAATILIADDDITLTEILKTKFSNGGFKVFVANNSTDAEKIMIEKKPQVTILDIMMPKKSGLEVLDDIRHNPQTKDLAVFILSNLNQKQDKDRAYALGVKDYIVKVDFSLDELFEKIAKSLI